MPFLNKNQKFWTFVCATQLGPWNFCSSSFVQQSLTPAHKKSIDPHCNLLKVYLTGRTKKRLFRVLYLPGNLNCKMNYCKYITFREKQIITSKRTNLASRLSKLKHNFFVQKSQLFVISLLFTYKQNTMWYV